MAHGRWISSESDVASAKAIAEWPDGIEAWPENGTNPSASRLCSGRGRPKASLAADVVPPARSNDAPIRFAAPVSREFLGDQPYRCQAECDGTVDLRLAKMSHDGRHVVRAGPIVVLSIALNGLVEQHER